MYFLSPVGVCYHFRDSGEKHHVRSTSVRGSARLQRALGGPGVAWSVHALRCMRLGRALCAPGSVILDCYLIKMLSFAYDLGWLI